MIMSRLTSLKRVLLFGWTNFKRARESSWITVLVIAVVVFLVSALFLLNGLSQAVINQVQERVSIAAYFQRGTAVSEIAVIRDDLKDHFGDQIQDIKIVSPEEALSHFLDRYRGDPLYQRALEQVGENPFLASLDITLGEVHLYAEVADYLTQHHADILSKVDYHHREDVIERVFNTTSRIQWFGVMAALLLTVLVVLIAFSSIRVSIHAARSEIETMKLVGASSWFIKAPFVVQGMVSGLFAALLVILIILPASYFLTPSVESLVPGFNLWEYLSENIVWLLAIQIIGALFLGFISTLLAVQRYLKK